MKRERGYTLVELMLALAIVGAMTATIGMVVHETVTIPDSGNDHVRALHAIQNAVHWVSRDGQAADSASGGGSLTLIMPDNTTVSYSLTGDELHRVEGGSDRTIAAGIESADFSIDGRLITMSIIAGDEGSGDISENGTCRIYMRPTP